MTTFRTFLTEGMIKLPPKLLHQMTRVFLENYLAWVQDKINDLEGKEYDHANKTLKKYLVKYGIDIDDMDTEEIGKKTTIPAQFMIDRNELPYIDKLKQLYPDYKALQKNSIGLVLDFKGVRANGVYNSPTQTITLYMKKLKLDEPLENLEQVLNRNIKISLGVLEHELTHAVQFMVLRHFHSQQISYNTNELKDMDAYYTGQVEFDPSIKTQVRRFKAFASEMRRMSKNYDLNLSMKVLVGAIKVTPSIEEKVLFTKPNGFFMALKKRKPSSWKKAVKLFYQAINS